MRELAVARLPPRRRPRHEDDSDVDSDDVPSSLPRLLTDCFVKDTEGYWDVPDERNMSQKKFKKLKEMVGIDLKLMRNLLDSFVEEFFQRDLMLSIQHHVEEECVNWMQERERRKLLEKQSRKRQRANAEVDADEKEKRKKYEDLKLLRMKQFGMR